MTLTTLIPIIIIFGFPKYKISIRYIFNITYIITDKHQVKEDICIDILLLQINDKINISFI